MSKEQLKYRGKKDAGKTCTSTVDICSVYQVYTLSMGSLVQNSWRKFLLILCTKVFNKGHLNGNCDFLNKSLKFGLEDYAKLTYKPHFQMLQFKMGP